MPAVGYAALPQCQPDTAAPGISDLGGRAVTGRVPVHDASAPGEGRRPTSAHSYRPLKRDG
jgi:hypothetical protein